MCTLSEGDNCTLILYCTYHNQASIYRFHSTALNKNTYWLTKRNYIILLTRKREQSGDFAIATIG